MSKTVKKVAGIAAPIVGNMLLPGIGGVLGGALGGAVTGGGLKGALTGAALGGIGSYGGQALAGLGQAAPGVSGGGGLLTAGGMPTGSALNLATGTGSNLLTAGGLPTGAAMNIAGAGASGLPTLNISGGSSMPASALPNYSQPSLTDTLTGGLRKATQSYLEPGSMSNTLGQVYSGIQGTEAYKDMARAQQAANERALAAVSPYQQAGVAAQSQLSNLLGLGADGDPEEILQQLQQTPGYQFRLGQGTKALEASQAARGGLLSGKALLEAQGLGQGLAEQTYNDYLQSLQSEAGRGLSAGTAMMPTTSGLGDVEAGRIYATEDLQNRALSNILAPRGY